MIALVDHVIDVAAIEASVRSPACGAVLVFVGTTRDSSDGRPVLRLEYEAYDKLAIAEMTAIASEIQARWADARCAMVHRIGLVPIGEASVVIAVATPHRGPCYEASRYAIEALKARVPIWKKEVYADGHAWRANPTTSR